MSFFYLRGGHGRMQLCRVVFFCVLAGQLTFAQHLFDVAKIALSAEQQAVLLAQTAQTRGEPLRSSNATPVKMSVAVPGSGKPGIVLINANSGQSVVLSGFSDRYPEAQLTPLLLAELRQLALGEAAEYLCLEVDDLTAATPQVKRALRVTADSDAVKLPEFKYGTRGNLRTAAAAERTLSAVLLLKPRYTPADPSDPASQQRIQELSEQNAYYAYVYVLPDGSRQLFSPKMAIADSSNARLLKSSTRSTALPFSLTMTGLTTQQQAAVNHAVNLWSQQLYGTIPVKMHIKFLDMGDSMMLGGCYEPNMWPAEDNSSLVPTSIMDQKMEENLRPGEYDIVMTFNTRFSFYFGLDANPPGSNPDFVTVLLHEMTHGLGFFDSINGETINGDLGSYLHGTPFIFDTFLYCNGSRLTSMTNSQRYSAICSNNLYFDGANAKSANGGSSIKLYAPAAYEVGSSVSHWDESVTFQTYMKYAYTAPLHSFGTRKLGLMKDLGWILASEVPDAPTGLNASDGTLTESVSLSWTASPGATGYKLYRCQINDTFGATLLSSPSGTTYTDSSASPGYLYYYWVKASNATCDSPFSASDAGYRALRTPTNVSATDNDTAAVTVRWSSVTGATCYRVWRATSADGTKTALGSWQSALSYTDSSAVGGTIYYYWVSAAVDSSGTRASAYSAFDTGERIGTGQFEDYSYTISNNQVSITDYTGTGGAITIPSTIEGKPVTSIGENAFYYCSDITGVTIPSSVTSIGVWAFGYCSSLTSVTIPGSVTSIGVWAFAVCSELTNITVETANPSYSSLDGVLFDKSKTALIRFPAGKSGVYLIPSSVTSIEEGAFTDCYGLTSVTIPNSVTSIGKAAFLCCNSLTSVTIPNSVTSIGTNTFTCCTGLTSVTIPNSVTSIGYAAFFLCSSLISVYFAGEPPTLGSDVFVSVPGTAYYLAETAGWGEEYGDLSTAVWTSEATFECNGGTPSFTFRNYNVGKVYGTLPTASRPVYTFAGWLTALDEGGVLVTDDTLVPLITTGHTLYAKWAINQYTITFDANGGNAVDPITQDYNSKVTLPTAPTKAGYTFTGWNPAVPTTMPLNGTTCVAQWTINTYTVTFISGEYGTRIGGGELQQQVAHGGAALAPEIEVAAGWHFVGWDQEFTEITGAITVNALYAAMNSVTFIPGAIGRHSGGGALQQSVPEGMAAEEPELGVVQGWSFERWDRDFQNITGDTTIRAVYSYEQSLRTGWNLISAKLNLVDESREPLLNNGAMTLDVKSKAYVSNWELAASQAVWIYCQNQTRSPIRLYGTADENFDFEASLKPGWNFVGPLYDHNLSNPDAIAWGWNGERFYPTNILRAGHSYYLYWPGDYVAPPEDNYLIIDLSAGSEADAYPVSYRSTPPAYGWTDEYKTTKLVLRKIPAGTFTMGSPANELGRWDDETQHQVTLTKDFYVGVFEVTQKQWERVMGVWPSYFSNVAYRDSRPVEQVSYNDIRGSVTGAGWPANNAVDADSFLGRLRVRTGLDFDLPTEAQWEYACRAGTTTSLNSGKNLTDDYECPNVAEVGRYWYNGGSGYSSGGDTSGGSAKVGSYLPNQWGLYDLHGNVWEWCLDWYQSELGSSAQNDPRGAAGGSYRVFRGGCWDNNARNCRSAYRYWGWRSFRNYYLGFRLVRAVP